MKNICLVCVVLLLVSCNHVGPKTSFRSPNSDGGTEYEIDPKFEFFEGGSFLKEKEVHDELIRISKQLMDKVHKRNAPLPMARDAHAKSHGCLKANFKTDNSLLAPQERVGLFSSNVAYPAWVRYSNNDHLPLRKDNQLDLRGMAIKLMGVEGPKILSSAANAKTQDFLMYGSEIFFIKDNKDYIDFIAGLRDSNAVEVLVKKTPRAAFLTGRAQLRVRNFRNPASMAYFSAVPVRLGLRENPHRQAMKYRAIPCVDIPHSQEPFTKDEKHYMRKNLKAALSKKPLCMKLQIQLQKKPENMPIEDSTIVWPIHRKGAPYLTVATIEIPQQEFDTPERDNYCEHLSFTPWHTLLAHKPLGRTMRMRRDLYIETAKYRRRVNGVTSLEPERYEID